MEKTSEYINANELKKRIENELNTAYDFDEYDSGRRDTLNWILNSVIAKLSAANVAPVVRGRWILSTNMTYMPQCSNCGRHPFKGYIPSIEEVKRVYKHCPVCGAKMDESEGTGNE